MSGNVWTLSPSNFTFLWKECRRCFYLEVVRNFRRPRPPMAKIFTRIDEEMRRHFHQRRTEEPLPELPPGVLDTTEYRVESAPIALPGRTSACVLKGKVDCIARFDNGSFAVVDFKTSAQNAEHMPLYARQLHAYALALENPAPGKLHLQPVTRLGLVVFEPAAFDTVPPNAAHLSGRLTWMELPKQEAAFRDFLAEVLAVLESPEPPASGRNCSYCAYREETRKTIF